MVFRREANVRPDSSRLPKLALPSTVLLAFLSAGCPPQLPGAEVECRIDVDCESRFPKADGLTCEANACVAPLDVNVQGGGVVLVQPGNIQCAGDCRQKFPVSAGVQLTLTATGTEHAFTGWMGSCTGRESCALTMDTAHTVTASFIQAYALTTDAKGPLTVQEGTSQSIAVALTAAPEQTVTVRIESSSPSAVRVTPETLEFGADNFSTSQAVSLDALQDDDVRDGNVTIKITVEGEQSPAAPLEYAVVVTDDDTLGLVVPDGALTVTEGTSNTIPVRLSAQPEAEVVVMVSGTGHARAPIDVTPVEVRFTTANWNVAQQVTVEGVNDADAVPGAGSVTFTSAGLPSQTVMVQVVEDDQQGFVLSESMLDMDPGQTATVAVSLAVVPVSPVAVNVTSTDPAAARVVRPEQLQFDDTNWDVPQIVEIESFGDDDLEDASVTVMLSSTEAQAGIAVVVRDPDIQSLVTDQPSYQVTEASTSTVMVSLRFRPSGTFQVQIASNATDVVIPSPAAVTFDETNFAVPQAVTLHGINDDDAWADDALLTLSAPGVSSVVPVHVVDDDGQAVVVSASSLSLREGSSGTFSVNLQTLPQSDVTVTMTVPDGMTVSPDRLVFAPSNYSRPQVITVSATEDCDVDDFAAAITLDAEGVDAQSGRVDVSIEDDDDQAIVPSQSSMVLAEQGSATLRVRLAFCPTVGQAVTVSVDDATAAQATPTTLNFTRANYDTAQVVTIAGLLDEDVASETTNLVLTTPGADDKVVQLNITDPDQVELRASINTVDLEEGDTQTIGVRLTHQPASDVQVDLRTLNADVATVSPAMMTFTPANYATPQMAVVTAVDDDDTLPENTLFEISATGAVNSPVRIPISVSDPDVQGLVADLMQPIQITEGASQVANVSLRFRPAGSVIVVFTPADGTRLSLAPSVVTFTPQNYATTQPVTISALDDADIADDTTSIEVQTTFPAPAIGVAITDDDSASLVVSPAALTVVEGSTEQLSVRLGFQPTSDVTLVVASQSPGAVVVSPAALTFGPGDWDVDKQVSVRAEPDQNLEDSMVNVTIGSAGFSPMTVPVTVTDPDEQRLLGLPQGVLSVQEGATALVGLSLEFQPSADVTIAIASTDPAAASVDVASMTFTPANYATPQVVELTANDDANVSNENVTINLTSPDLPGGGQAVPVTVLDDDQQGISVLGPNPMNLTEGAANGQMQVRLQQQPAGDSVVNIVASDTTAIDISPSSMTFTPTNWNLAQTLTVTPRGDDDTADENATVTLSAGGMSDRVINVSVSDDDVQQIVATTQTVNVGEGAATTLGVSLAFQPEGSVTVAVESSDPGAVTAAPTTLTFTPTTYQVAQTVTVQAVQDDDVTNESLQIGLSAAGISATSIAVSVSDDDVQALVLDDNTANLGEGTSVTRTLRLAFQPAAPVTVSLASSDPTALTVSPTTMVFAPAAFASPQTLTLSAVDDVDTVGETVTITINALSIPAVNATAVITDDDVQSIVADRGQLTVNEGASTTLGVRLMFAPANPTTVTVTSGAPQASVTPGALTFTAANYSVVQTVTINGVPDADAASVATNLTLSAAGIPDTVVGLDVVDDEVQAIDVARNAINVNEGGNSTFGVTLAAQPLSPVTVTVVSSDLAAVSVSPATLVFTSADYDTPHVVTVAGVEDVDTVAANADVTLSAPSLSNIRVSVSVMDDDQQEIVVGSPSVTVNEEGLSSVSLRLAFQPQADVTVNVASSDEAVVSVSPTWATFTPANYDSVQTITLAGQPDADSVNDNATVTFSATGLANVDIPVTVNDDDTASIIASPTVLSVDEEGTASLSVRLSVQPTGSQPVTIVSLNQQAATVNPTTLLFDANNWDTPQTVTVTGVLDQNTDDEVTTLRLSSASMADVEISTTVVDDDVQAIVSSPASIELTEQATADVDIRLAFQPSQDVTVNVTSSDPGAVTVSQSALTFTTANWNTNQRVTVTGVDDIDTRDESATITLSSAATPDQSVAVTVTDPDVQSILVNPDSVTVAEGGSTTFTVRFAFEPDATQVVDITSSDTGATSVNPASVTLSPQNYDQPMTVTVSGAQDADAADESTTLTLTSAGAPDAQVAVSVTDDDTQGIVISPSSLTVTEGQSGTIFVSLMSDPQGTAVVNVTTGDPAAASPSTAQLSFTSANYQTAQQVDVSGVQDQDVGDESTTMTFAATGMPVQVVDVSVTDDDVQTLVVSQSSVTIGEAGTDSFTVALMFEPVSNVSVNVASSDTGAVTVAPTTLTFTAANYATAQQVVLTGVADDDVADEAASVSVSSSGISTVPVAVSVTDDDTQSLVFSPSSLAIQEGNAGSISVNLAFNPQASTTVDVATSNVNRLSTGVTTLTFTAANYATPQTVIVTALHDGDADDHNEQVTLTLEATPSNVPVSISDDDEIVTISLEGAGVGTVTSVPSGISCPGTCSAVFPSATILTLNAGPTSPSIFTGWSGDCGGTGSCVLSVTGPVNVSASFLPGPGIKVAGSVGGLVRSIPAGIECGEVCEADFTAGTNVIVDAHQFEGFTFVDWVEPICAGQGPSCSFSVTGLVELTPIFRAGPFELSYAYSGPTLSQPTSATMKRSTGDLDDDGDVDILAVRGTFSEVRWFRNEGDGTVTDLPIAVASTPRTVSVADLDNDGDLDFIHSRFGTGGARIFVNDGAGGFTDSLVEIGSATPLSQYEFFEIAPVDFDNDGDLDLVTAASGGIHTFRNDGNLTFVRLTTNIMGTAGVPHLTFLDYDDDGDQDMFVASVGGTFDPYLNNGSGGFTVDGGHPTLPPFVPEGLGMFSADMDGDDDEDAIVTVREPGFPDAFFYIQNNGGTLDFMGQIGEGTELVVQDFNGDGLTDVLGLSSDGSTPSRLYHNDGAGFVRPFAQLPATTIDGAAIDVDGDHDLDLFLSHDTANSQSIMLARDGLDDWFFGSPMTANQMRHGAAVYRNHVYVAGGEDDQGTVLDTSYYAQFDDFGNLMTWTTGPSLPQARRHNTMVAANGQIFSLGGSTNGGSDRVYYATLSTAGIPGAWMTGMDMPDSRDGVGAVVCDGRIYVTGGRRLNAAGNNVWYADILPAGGVSPWIQGPALPGGRWGHSMVAHNGYLYVVGGQSSTTSYLTTVLSAKVNPNGSVGPWLAQTAMPFPRSEMGVTIHDGKLIVVGGEQSSTNHVGSVMQARFTGNGTISGWETTAMLDIPRAEGALVTHRDHIFMIGGTDGFGTFSDVNVSEAAVQRNFRVLTPDTFVQGSPISEQGRDPGESEHDVTLTRRILMMEAELSQGQWFNPPGVTAMAGNTTCGLDCPMENVSYDEIIQFANMISEEAGFEECYTGNAGNWTFIGLDCTGYRLPTEAEWEYAARGGTTPAFYSGDIVNPTGPDDNLDEAGWYASNTSMTMLARQRTANPYGLYDMLGNVSEWVYDRFGPYSSMPATDPLGPPTGPDRVIRGGAYDSMPMESRAAARDMELPGNRSVNLGFRLVRTLED